ncbi:MAG: hypothetical protein ACK4IX_16080, partial [Candidatus Sericytochromatia bacterium]
LLINLISYLFAKIILGKKKEIKTTEVNDTNNNFWRFCFSLTTYITTALIIFGLILKYFENNSKLNLSNLHFQNNYLIYNIAIHFTSIIFSVIYFRIVKINYKNQPILKIFATLIVLSLCIPVIVFSSFHSVKKSLIDSNVDLDTTRFDSEQFSEKEISEDDALIKNEYSFVDLWDDPEDDTKNVTIGFKTLIQILAQGGITQMDSDLVIESDNITNSSIKSHNDLYFLINSLSWMKSETVEIKDIDKGEESYQFHAIRSMIKTYSKNCYIYFKKYKDIGYSIVDKKLYTKLCFDKIVKMLILAYNDLESSNITDDIKDRIYLKYEINEEYLKDEKKRKSTLELFNYIKPYTKEEVRNKIYEISDYYDEDLINMDVDFVAWAYSFWI